MHSICYVVLPHGLTLNNNFVYKFVRNQISKYYSQLEVSPYKSYFSKERTLEIAKSKGFSRLDEFEEYLKIHNDEDGIENGLYYWITTYNTQGRWDAIRLDGIAKVSDIMNQLPYSVVTPDGVWHSECDFGYRPILDFNIGGQHPDNIESEKKWKCFLSDFYVEYAERYLAIIDIHS